MFLAHLTVSRRSQCSSLRSRRHDALTMYLLNLSPCRHCFTPPSLCQAALTVPRIPQVFTPPSLFHAALKIQLHPQCATPSNSLADLNNSIVGSI